MSRLLPLLLLAACGSKEVLITPFDTGAVGDTGETGDTAPVDTGPTEEELDAIWGDARLVVTSPSSGDFIPLGESAHFEAVVVNGDGLPLGFTDIQWNSDIDTAWAPIGDEFEDAGLVPGTHNLTATANLPNGDRLVYTVGGVLVQAEDAGLYVGDVMVDITVEYDGTPYTLTCIGSTTVIVDVYGETATGDSSCTLSLFGYDLEAVQELNLEVSDGDLEGPVTLDATLFTYDFEAEGNIGDGELEASWADDVEGYAEVAGELSATRISRSTETSE